MPQIVYQPPRPNSLNNLIGAAAGWQAGREQKEELERRRQAFELDKQQAEFELATAKQEQARKIESEDAYKQGVQWAIKNQGQFESPHMQQASAIAAATADPNQKGYRGKGALRLKTKAEEEYDQHESQKLQEAQAIASRMQPEHAKAFLEEVGVERQSEKIQFAQSRMRGSVSQLAKNGLFGEDEDGAAMAEQLNAMIDAIDPLDSRGAAVVMDKVNEFVDKAIEARAESNAIGITKQTNIELATRAHQEYQARGATDEMADIEIRDAIERYATIDVTSKEDAVRYGYKLEDEIDEIKRGAKERKREAARMSQSRSNPAKTLADLEGRAYARIKNQIALELRDTTQSPVTQEEINAEVVAQARRLGLPEESFKHLLPQPSDIQRLKEAWRDRPKGGKPANGQGPGAGRRAAQRQQQERKLGPGGTPQGAKLSTLKAGQRAAAYRQLAAFKLQGLSLEQAKAKMRERGWELDDVDLAEVQRQMALQAKDPGGDPNWMEKIQYAERGDQ